MEYPQTEEWLSDLGADDFDIINEWQMKSINNSVIDDCFNSNSWSYSAYPSSSDESIQEIHKVGMAKSTKKDLGSYSSSQKESQKAANPNIISFGDTNSPKISKQKRTIKAEAGMLSAEDMDFIYETVEYGEPIKKSINRTPLEAKEHVLAERKRRERLSERFVALSTMIPDLKKLDKASVLGGAIKYLNRLQERLKMLEDEKERRQEESIHISSVSKRTGFSSSDEISSSDNNSEISLDQKSPEIEVRISDTSILVRVYCEKRTGIIKEILCEIEKLHLEIISTSVIPFGSTTLSITLIAQMDGEDCVKALEIANYIRMAIQKITQ